MVSPHWIMVYRTNSYDCGTPMNPGLDIGQMEGAFVMGLGFYTREQQLWLPDGTNAVCCFYQPGHFCISHDFFESCMENTAIRP